MSTAPDLLTPAEVARIFRVSASTVSRWGKAGVLKPIRIEGVATVRYRRSEIEAFLNREPAA